MYGYKINNLSKENDKYGFLDENEIRIATGISLIFAITAFFLVILKAEFIIALYIISIIWLDFFLKVVFSPKLGIFTGIVKLFRKNAKANRIGAIQKRFAWSIGLLLSTLVVFCLMILGGLLDVSNEQIILVKNTIANNLINGSLFVVPIVPPIIACILCIIFMWLETVFGYCVGCKIYQKLVKKGLVKKYENQNCVNGACEIESNK